MKGERRAPNSSSGSTQLRSAPLGFSHNGVYNNNSGSLNGIDIGGYYWSRSVYSIDSARIVEFNSYVVDSASLSTRGTGLAVRCVEG